MTCPSLLCRGQITVFVLLLGLLGLTIGLSAASRSLSDLKQATYTETGTKALAGAEAGLQYGLLQLKNANLGQIPASGCGQYVDLVGTNVINLAGFGPNGIRYRICTQSQPYFSDSKSPDDVMEVDISKVQVSSGNTATDVKSYRIAWNTSSAAVEVAFLDQNFNINRYAAYNTGNLNYFLAANSGSGGCGGAGGSGYRYIDISSDPNNTNLGGLLLRVKPMFAAANLYVCGLNSSSGIVALNANYYTVEVIATTTSGTVSHLSSKKTSNGLPSVFDNALFSQGSITQ